MVELVQELICSSTVPVGAAPSSEAPADIGKEKKLAKVLADFEKHQARLADLESVEMMTIRRHQNLLNELKQPHAKKVTVWLENSRDSADSLNNDVRVAKAEAIKMSVDRNLILARYKRHLQALRA